MFSVMLLASGLLFTGHSSPQPPSPAVHFLEAEVHCCDGSTLKVKLLDEKLEMVTRHGTVQILVSDIREIKCATRFPPETMRTVQMLIGQLNDRDDVRISAVQKLSTMRAAHHALLAAAKDENRDRAKSAEQALESLKKQFSAAQLEMRLRDVVITDDCTFSGMLSATTLRVDTVAFGVQQLKLCDVMALKAASSIALKIVPAPEKLIGSAYDVVGTEYLFSITGRETPRSIWGTDYYTSDSDLSTAAGHAGKVRPGETKVVRVRIAASPGAFVGTTRNGITSLAFGQHPGNAFFFPPSDP